MPLLAPTMKAQTTIAVRATQRRGVARSAEFRRVLDLPRRSLDQYDRDVAEALSEHLRRPGSTFTFFPQQAAMLLELAEVGGLFSMAPTGGGKTTVAAAFGMMTGARRPLLIIPPSLRLEIHSRVLPRLAREFAFVPPAVVTYAELGLAKNADLLDRLRPDLIVCDEAHLLKNKNAARTKRFLSYVNEHPDVPVVLMSGTFQRRSLRDFGHLLYRTHRGASVPITRQWKELEEWADALDPNVHPSQRLAPGALAELARPGESVREAFGRRLLDTAGVIGGAGEQCGAQLTWARLPLSTPLVVERALAALRSAWVLPNGEELVDALEFYRRARELAQGFYYVWRWPEGVPTQDDLAWLAARKAWRAAVAGVTKLSRKGLDSELLVRNAAEREATGKAEGSTAARLPESMRASVVSAWHDWERYREWPEPPSEPVWLDTFFVEALVAQALRHDDDHPHGVLVWYESLAVEQALAAHPRVRDGSVALCPSGDKGSHLLNELAERPPGEHLPVLLARSHGMGKNLQRWSRNVVGLPFSGGGDWTQTIARTHRPGQDADVVHVEFFAHTYEARKALHTAWEQSIAIAEVTTAPQKLLQGDWLGYRPADFADEEPPTT